MSATNDALVTVQANDSITSVYETNVRARAHNVPFGIALLGCFKSMVLLINE